MLLSKTYKYICYLRLAVPALYEIDLSGNEGSKNPVLPEVDLRNRILRMSILYAKLSK